MPDLIRNSNTSMFTQTDKYGLPMFNMIENYIYLYHIDKYIILPAFVDSVNDTQQVSFVPSAPLSRSAPIQSYSNSGPRTVQVHFNLHRELMYQINKDLNSIPDTAPPGVDYVDLFIKYIQAAVLPAYKAAEKMVNPPVVALRLGNDIFIKGVIAGNVGLTYNYPILDDGRYALVDITFGVTEIDPYDAQTVMITGSYRNVSTNLERKNVIISGDGGYSSFGNSGKATTTANSPIYSSVSQKNAYTSKTAQQARMVAGSMIVSGGNTYSAR